MQLCVRAREDQESLIVPGAGSEIKRKSVSPQVSNQNSEHIQSSCAAGQLGKKVRVRDWVLPCKFINRGN